MSSTSTPVTTTETINQPFGKVPNISLTIQYQHLDATSSPEELKVAFDMLDALLEDTSFAKWEH